MVADSDWSTLLPAGAFILGAILATIMVLRVVRAVIALATGTRQDRSWWRRRDERSTHDEPTD